MLKNPNRDLFYIGGGTWLDLDYLAHDLADDLTSDRLIDFIMSMDLRRADLDFTQRLYATLGDAVREELEADVDLD